MKTEEVRKKAEEKVFKAIQKAEKTEMFEKVDITENPIVGNCGSCTGCRGHGVWNETKIEYSEEIVEVWNNCYKPKLFLNGEEIGYELGKGFVFDDSISVERAVYIARDIEKKIDKAIEKRKQKIQVLEEKLENA